MYLNETGFKSSRWSVREYLPIHVEEHHARIRLWRQSPGTDAIPNKTIIDHTVTKKRCKALTANHHENWIEESTWSCLHVEPDPEIERRSWSLYRCFRCCQCPRSFVVRQTVDHLLVQYQRPISTNVAMPPHARQKDYFVSWELRRIDWSPQEWQPSDRLHQVRNQYCWPTWKCIVRSRRVQWFAKMFAVAEYRWSRRPIDHDHLPLGERLRKRSSKMWIGQNWIGISHRLPRLHHRHRQFRDHEFDSAGRRSKQTRMTLV